MIEDILRKWLEHFKMRFGRRAPRVSISRAEERIAASRWLHVSAQSMMREACWAKVRVVGQAKAREWVITRRLAMRRVFSPANHLSDRNHKQF